MDPAAVLTEQQRQLRFRKFIERKKGQKNVPETGIKKIKRSESGLCPEKVKPSTSQQQHRHRQVQQQHRPEQQQDDPRQLQMLNKSTASLQAKITTIVQCHKTTFAQSDDIFLQKLDNISEEDLSLNINREEFFSYIEKISASFQKFSLLQKYLKYYFF